MLQGLFGRRGGWVEGTRGTLRALFETREEHKCYRGGYRWVHGGNIYNGNKNVNFTKTLMSLF